MTIPTQLVLQVFLDDATRDRYGSDIGAEAGLPSGTVHPILARLEGFGWLESRWEDIDPRVEGRPARRYYRLTGAGAQSAQLAVARAYRPRRGFSLPHPASGEA
jgi:DNA-binding PadR family transcriptional regulator